MTLYKEMTAYDKARHTQRKELVRESHKLMEKIWPGYPERAYKYLTKKLNTENKHDVHFTHMTLTEVIVAYNLLRQKAIDDGLLKPKFGPRL